MFELPIKITVNAGEGSWELTYAGDRLLSIGRSPECDIIIDSDKASRRHAEIIGEGGRFTLIDAGSANGTRVNGEKVRRHSLAPGDVIGIGRARIVFGAAVEATPPDEAVAPVGASSAAPVAADAPTRTVPTAERPASPGPSRRLPPRRSGASQVLNVVIPIILLGGLGLVIWQLVEETPGDDRARLGTPAQEGSRPPGDPAVGGVGELGAPSSGPGPDDVSPPGNDAARVPGGLTAQADLDALLAEARAGALGWAVVERLRLLADSNPGTPAAEQARRWIPIFAGLRGAVERQENAAVRHAVDDLIRDERYGEALATVSFLVKNSTDDEQRTHWRRTIADVEERARSRFHQVEKGLGELVAAGKPDEALRALVDQRLKYAGTAIYEELLPRFVDSGLARRPVLERRRPQIAELTRLREQLGVAFQDCRFGDMVPIYYRILALDPEPADRIDALEGLVEATYLHRLLEAFLGEIAGQAVDVSLSETYRGRVVRADYREVEHEIDLSGQPYRKTEPWAKVPAVKKVALFSSVKLDRDALFGLAIFCFRQGFEEGAERALIRLNKRKDSRDLVSAVLARHRGVAVPEEGYVEYRGRLLTPADRVAAIADRERGRQEEIARLKELKKLELASKAGPYIERARRLRTERHFEAAQRILEELAAHKKLGETDVGAEARRLLADPYLTREVLVMSGPAANRLDIAIMGEGFPVDDDYQDSFGVYANTCKNLLLTEEPYREYASYLNFFTVYLGSRDTGLSTGADRGNVKRDTPLGGKVEWSVITCDGSRVHEILDRVTGGDSDHVAVVIGNDFADVATGGGGIACLSKAGLTPVGHELGHGIGGLHDEYDNPAGNDPDRPLVKKRRGNVPTRPRPPNLMEGSDRDDVLAHACWRSWIEAGEDKWWNGAEVGVFEGGGYSPFEIWRPQANCKMRSASVNFCVVCMEVMVKAIYRRVRPIDRVEPPEDEVTLRDGRELVFKVWPMKPATHYLEATWTLLDLGADVPKPEDDGPTVVDDDRPGEIHRRVGRMTDAEGRVVEVAQIRSRDLRGGRYRLRIVLRDPTPWVLDDPEGLLSETRDWIIRIE